MGARLLNTHPGTVRAATSSSSSTMMMTRIFTKVFIALLTVSARLTVSATLTASAARPPGLPGRSRDVPWSRSTWSVRGLFP